MERDSTTPVRGGMERIVHSHLLGLLHTKQMVVAVGVVTHTLAAPVGAAAVVAQTAVAHPLGVPNLVRELDSQGVPGMALPRRGTTGAVAAVARVKQATMRPTPTLEVAGTGQRTITVQVQRYNDVVAVVGVVPTASLSLPLPADPGEPVEAPKGKKAPTRLLLPPIAVRELVQGVGEAVPVTVVLE